MINNLLFNINTLLNVVLNIFLFIVIIFLIIFIFSFIVLKKAFGRSKILATENNPIYEKYQPLMKEGERYFKKLNYEELTIISYDNLKLKAYFYENPNSKGTVIFMHGYHGNPLTDFGPVIKTFKEMGYSLLLPYQRAHGKSQGKYVTFGVNESKDCLKWAKYIAKRYPNRSIALHGVSLGGATVGMASSFEDLPKEVKVIANDSGFSSPDDIISSVRKSMKLPFFPFQLIVRLYAKVFAKFSLTKNSVTKSYEKSKIPALFIHGEEDDYVPYYMGVQNYEKSNAKEKLLISVKGAGHGLAYMTEPERVTKELADFYNKHM
ncbi:MAG: alpha/beta hydrolase [Clostridia bacterium]|nr:alpha/beta hydrolase [Clostridia bacterium]